MRNEKAEEKRIQDLFDTYYRLFGLDWLTINLKFRTRTDDDARIVAETITDWEYRQASIEWNLTQTAALSDKEPSDTVIHEIVHILNAPLWRSLSDKVQVSHHTLNEFATENVARVIANLVDLIAK